MTEPQVRKLSYGQPLAKGTCEVCGQPLLYNLALDHLTHENPNLDFVCTEPFPEVLAG